MRRSALVVLAAAALAAVGCETGFDEGKENARPLKVAHALGESKVPGLAERPLALSDGALDATLALGVRPAGAALPGDRAPRYLSRRAPRLEVAPRLTRSTLRTARAFHPDVIIGMAGRERPLYRRLGRIAPTVMSEPGPGSAYRPHRGMAPDLTSQGSGGGDWELDLRLFGEALGRTNAAERLLLRWDDTAARARRALGARGRPARVAVVRVVRGGLRVAGADSFAGRVLEDAGLGTPQAKGAFEPLDPRRLGSLDADVILLSSAPGARTALGPSDAVRVDDRLWWEGDGVLAARAALRDLEHTLAR